MASNGSGGALWAKLYELEVQLAAYKLLRAARGDDVVGGGGESGGGGAAAGTCRGRQYDAYMRRRDERRMGVAVDAPAKGGLGQEPRPRAARAGGGGGGRPSPLSLKLAGGRDAHEVGARVAVVQVRRTPAAVSVPSTPRKEALPRSRTVSTGAAAAAGCTTSRTHQRRNSVASGDADFGDVATPRPFLRRGTGTGGAAVARPRTARVHDLPPGDAYISSPRQPPQDHPTKAAARRHSRSVSELPFRTAAAMDSPRPAVEPPAAQARERKRWGSPERTPPAMFSAADSHSDFAKGLRKLLSFMRKSSSNSRSTASAAEQPHCPARHAVIGGERDSGGKPVKGWAAAAACSLLDGTFDRASMEAHQFPMTQAVGISG